MTREEMLRQYARATLAEIRPQCLAISLLLFDRAEDGSFKPEYVKNCKEVLDDPDDNDEATLLPMLAARVAMVATMCDEESDYYGIDIATTLGVWATLLMEAEIAIVQNRSRSN